MLRSDPDVNVTRTSNAKLRDDNVNWFTSNLVFGASAADAPEAAVPECVPWEEVVSGGRKSDDTPAGTSFNTRLRFLPAGLGRVDSGRTASAARSGCSFAASASLIGKPVTAMKSEGHQEHLEGLTRDGARAVQHATRLIDSDLALFELTRLEMSLLSQMQQQQHQEQRQQQPSSNRS